jgi:LAO/AO transport system kinase
VAAETRSKGARASLAERLLAGEKRALARGITLVENDDPAGWELVRTVYPRTGNARNIGFTGPPGVGKSTLIAALVKHSRGRDREVGVLSIDPSSPFTEGALLGDRIRLAEHFLDEGVYIRSMASRGALGGLAEATLQAVLLMDAAGKEEILIETVGVGQAETEVADVADTVVVVVQPASGDVLQFYKAGIMEIPDVLVVTKADLGPIADAARRDLVAALRALGAAEVDVVSVSSISPPQGIDDLIAALDAHRETADVPARRLRARRRHALADFAAEHGERGLRSLGGRREAERFLDEQDQALDVPSLLEALEKRAADGP